MTPEECAAVLGPKVASRVMAEAEAQPGPTPELIEFLRRIFAPAATHSESRRAA